MSDIYAERDIVEQGDYYFRHASAMTGEGLHHKSNIAAELAHRDIQIDDLRQQLEASERRKEELLALVHDMEDEPFIKRVQAEAVDNSLKLYVCGMEPEDFYSEINAYSCRLRKEAAEAENGGDHG